jgi:hypothetical protein
MMRPALARQVAETAKAVTKRGPDGVSAGVTGTLVEAVPEKRVSGKVAGLGGGIIQVSIFRPAECAKSWWAKVHP